MTHGTSYGYKRGCRCESCRSAERDRMHRWRRSKGIVSPKERAATRFGTPEERLERKRARWRENNRNRADYQKEWARKNRASRRESLRKWQRSEKGRAWLAINQAKRRGAPGKASRTQLLARIDYYGGCCYLCREAPWEHVDHVIPLARGGTNWPANLRPACASCNLSKGAT